VRYLRATTAVAGLAVLAAVGVFSPLGTGTSSELAYAQSSGSQVSQLLAQVRRNAKVSERLNAGFFRAPQTQGYTGSTFRPTDSDTAYTADRGDSSLSLDATRASNETEQNSSGATVVKQVPQTTGTFEVPLDVPNRAQVVEVQSSYKDAAGGNGMQFQVVKLGQLGDQAQALFDARSTDGRTGTDTTQLGQNAFRVDNSRNRYVLRVKIDDVNPETRFYGITIQYVIGKDVPGAPSS
jgi:hypothetical protein